MTVIIDLKDYDLIKGTPWREELHPRGKDGKFSSIRGGSKVVAKNGTKGKVTQVTDTHYHIEKEDGKTSKILKDNVIHEKDHTELTKKGKNTNDGKKTASKSKKTATGKKRSSTAKSAPTNTKSTSTTKKPSGKKAGSKTSKKELTTSDFPGIREQLLNTFKSRHEGKPKKTLKDMPTKNVNKWVKSVKNFDNAGTWITHMRSNDTSTYKELANYGIASGQGMKDVFNNLKAFDKQRSEELKKRFTKGKAEKGDSKSATTKKPASKKTTKKTADKPSGTRNPVSRTKKPATKSRAKSKADIRSEAQKNRNLAYDAGEKIGGARKDTWEQNFKFDPNLNTLADLEKDNPAVAQKLAVKKVILPTFDFQKEHDKGVDLPTAIMKKLIFDRIAPKPADDSPESRKAYVHGINKAYRHFEGVKTLENMKNAIREFADIAGGISKYNDAKSSLEKYHENPNRYTYFNEEYHKTRMNEAKKYLGQMDFEALGDKFEGFFTSYKSRESTLKTVAKNTKEGWGKYLNPDKKPATTKPKDGNKKWERKAEAEHLRTGGKKVTMTKPEEMMKTFGVRGVEFGHWVNDASGKYHLQRSAEAFHDLADVLGIDSKDVSLNGRLAIAFGARGKGGALAHYEPDRKVINMTKHGGAGSLAHEWGHAMDNILYQYSKGGTESLNLASDGVESMGDNDPKLKVLYQNVMDAITKPAPGDKGAVKTINMDSSEKPPGRYYPEMRRDIQGGMSPEDTYNKWATKIHEQHDRYIANARANRTGLRSQADIDKAVKKYESARKRELNQLPHYLALEMRHKQNDGKYGGDHYKGSINVPTGKSEYHQRMIDTDGNGKNYWSQGAEMFARVFESYVQDKLDKSKRYNNYLVHGTRESNVKSMDAPFPIGKERTHMFKAMDNLLKHITKGKALKKALILEVLASGSGDMTEELRKSHDLKEIFDSMWKNALDSQLADLRSHGVNTTGLERKRSSYNVANPEEVIYIPLNRLRTPYQTEKATNHDKVQQNYERMIAGENLEPIVIGLDYDIHDGHHRYEASQLADFEHAPCIVKGGNELERQRAIEAYREIWKSFNEGDHPRDSKGMFTKVYHTSKEKDFKYDPSYKNSGQEWGSGLYTAPAEDMEYWHMALADPSTGDRHPYVIPMDISEAKLMHVHDMPGEFDRADALIAHYGGEDEALQALEDEEKNHVTGETYGLRPHEIAERRQYAKIHGYDGIIAHDSKEGHQVVLFDDSKVKYEPAMDAYDMLKKHRWGEL